MVFSDAIRRVMHTLYEKERFSSGGTKRRYVHYTSPEAFVSIFGSYIENQGVDPRVIESCVMRATHLRYMNDAEEYKSGLLTWNKLKKFANTTKPDDYDEVYSISFCSNQNLLSQWKWYGKNSGIAIEFDMDNIYFRYWEPRVYQENITLIKALYLDVLTRPLSAKYDEQEKEIFFREIEDAFQEMSLGLDTTEIQRKLFVPFCKHSGFSEEQESRLIFYPIADKCIKPPQIHYYPSRKMIKPSMNITFEAKDKKKNIIKGLTVGPGHNQEMIYQMLRLIFQNNQEIYEKIEKSEIPFRG